MQIDLTYQVLYSELAQRSLDAAFSTDFDVSGRFIKMESRGRKYWYFDTAKPDGGKGRRYVGPVDDAAITQRVEAFNMEAMDRGPHWREAVLAGIDGYEPTLAATVRALLSRGIRKLDADPAGYILGPVVEIPSWEL